MSMPFTFVGTTAKNIALDPEEFAGQSVPQITAEIVKTLRDIAPDVNFYDQDVTMAAVAIHDRFDTSDAKAR